MRSRKFGPLLILAAIVLSSCGASTDEERLAIYDSKIETQPFKLTWYAHPDAEQKFHIRTCDQVDCRTFFIIECEKSEKVSLVGPGHSLDCAVTEETTPYAYHYRWKLEDGYWKYTIELHEGSVYDLKSPEDLQAEANFSVRVEEAGKNGPWVGFGSK